MAEPGTYGTKIGGGALKKEVVDSMVKQIAARAYKFKQACAVVSTLAWKNTFHREQTDVPAGQTGAPIKGIPPGAAFPQYSISWKEISVNIFKYGLEENIPWESILTSEINVQARTIIKITEGVVKAVDDEIWDKLSLTQGTASATANPIQSFAIASGYQWNAGLAGASAAILSDLMKASQLIAQKNYAVNDLICFISPSDKTAIMGWLAAKGAQFPAIATDITTNGRIGKLAGITLVESNSVSGSCALVCKPKTCATWKELVPIQSNITEDPYKSVRVRVVEEGVLQVQDPLAIVLIKNTS